MYKNLVPTPQQCFLLQQHKISFDGVFLYWCLTNSRLDDINKVEWVLFQNLRLEIVAKYTETKERKDCLCRIFDYLPAPTLDMLFDRLPSRIILDKEKELFGTFQLLKITMSESDKIYYSSSYIDVKSRKTIDDLSAVDVSLADSLSKLLIELKEKDYIC